MSRSLVTVEEVRLNALVLTATVFSVFAFNLAMRSTLSMAYGLCFVRASTAGRLKEQKLGRQTFPDRVDPVEEDPSPGPGAATGGHGRGPSRQNRQISHPKKGAAV